MKKIINSIYLIPAILEYINNTRDEIQVPSYVKDILNEYEINEKDLNDLKKLENLLRYNIFMIKSNFKRNYPLLRIGLDEYFNLYLSTIFQDLKITNKKLRFFDYGSGNGIYSEQFLKDNPSSDITILDRNMGLKIDFEKTPNWYQTYTNSYDLVLVSELLHCKSLKIQEYIIQSSYKILKENGNIIINENQDPFMDMRLNKMTSKGQTIPIDQLKKLLERNNFEFKDHKIINYHNILYYGKQ